VSTRAIIAYFREPADKCFFATVMLAEVLVLVMLFTLLAKFGIFAPFLFPH